MEKNFGRFFRTFLTNRGKNENEDEKYGEMNSIFEFPDSFFKTFLTNESKNENENEKN